ncbi:MAG: RagB/SusD family nutrient uptake outer membrane protein, partial [Gemmatimonadota bacterium]|nr:RagB/SusD family nutrient uptake outer membrane protein [Gemmatimonadota bacterium]
ENILVVKNLNESGLGLNFVMRALHYNHISPSPWNGFSTLASTFNSFDTDDERTDIFLVGPQVNLETGEPITDRSGAPLVITPDIGNVRQASESEGVRIVKWRLDPERVAENNSNDVAYFRLAEMYMIKAEAMNELGMTGAAVDIVNQLRARVFEPDEPINAADFTQASFRDRILQERLWEFTAEAKRRQDLIRHGKFTDAWEFKPPTEPFRILMPIPQPQLDTNPELTQNPGY